MHLSASPECLINSLRSSSPRREDNSVMVFIGFLSAVVSENGFVLFSGSKRNTFERKEEL